MSEKIIILIVVLGFLVGSCINNEPSLTPRIMKEVNKEFRKSRKDIKTEADSLCSIYREEHLQTIVDSILEARIKKDQEKKITIN